MSPDNGRLRLGLAGFVVLALFGAMFARLWYLQVLDANSFRKAAVTNQVRNVLQAPPRGEIMDRNGTVLVENQTSEEVTLQRNVATRHPEVVDRLAALVNVPVGTIYGKLDDLQYSPFEPVPIAPVDINKVVYIEEHQGDLPGVQVSLVTQRSYPYGNQQTASQLLGYTGQISPSELGRLSKFGYQQGDVVGKAGVEAGYESFLRGRPGDTQLEVNAQGQVIGTLRVTPPTPGDNVELTIDLGLQQELEKDLGNQIKSLHGTYDSSNGALITATSGAAVVLDPRNGDVLAMASYPSYDPSVWAGGISKQNFVTLNDPANGEPLLNRAIQGTSTPGSTFKLVTATAALNTGLITPDDYINDPGSFTVPGCRSGTGQCTFKDADNGGLGSINIVTALTQSSDVFFYNLGYDFYVQSAHYGQTPIQDMAKAYGYGQPTGIQIPGEASGRVDSLAERQYLYDHYPKDYSKPAWFPGDNIELAFGQGQTLITPLQLANAYATFANGGTRYQPQVVSQIYSPDDKRVVKRLAPVVSGHVDLPGGTHDPIYQGLLGVPQNGTAAGAFGGFPLSEFPVAGKTGTATTPNAEPNSLFVAFAPAPNPQYVVAVVIDQGGYGAAASAPVARQVLDYLRTHPIGPAKAPHPGG